MPLDNKKLAVIHILKKELNLSEEEYRGKLMQVTGVSSSKDLSEEAFQKLMHYFVRSKYYKLNEQGLTIKQKLYIEHLVFDLKWDNQHFSNFLAKYYHKPSLQSLSKKEASKVIESLKHISHK